MGKPENGLRQRGNDGEEFSRDCWLKWNEGAGSLLLPQREPPSEDVDPSHGREGCQFINHLFQHREIDMCDLLDGARIVKYRDIRLLLGK